MGERGDRREKGDDQTGLPGRAGKEERGPRRRVWRIGEFNPQLTKLRPESREERKQSSGERAAAERKKGAKGEGEN